MKHFQVFRQRQRYFYSLGRPEYSYYFVPKEFLPVLQQLGAVNPSSQP